MATSVREDSRWSTSTTTARDPNKPRSKSKKDFNTILPVNLGTDNLDRLRESTKGMSIDAQRRQLYDYSLALADRDREIAKRNGTIGFLDADEDRKNRADKYFWDFQEGMPGEKITGNEMRGENGFTRFLGSPRVLLNTMNNAIGSGIDWGIDRFGDLAGVVTGSDDVRENIQNFTTGEDIAPWVSMAESLGIMAAAPMTAPVILAGKGLIENSDDFYEAMSGVDNVSGAELTDSQRGMKALSGAVGTALETLPGASSAKAARNAAKNYLKKESDELAGKLTQAQTDTQGMLDSLNNVSKQRENAIAEFDKRIAEQEGKLVENQAAREALAEQFPGVEIPGVSYRVPLYGVEEAAPAAVSKGPLGGSALGALAKRQAEEQAAAQAARAAQTTEMLGPRISIDDAISSTKKGIKSAKKAAGSKDKGLRQAKKALKDLQEEQALKGSYIAEYAGQDPAYLGRTMSVGDDELLKVVDDFTGQPVLVENIPVFKNRGYSIINNGKTVSTKAGHAPNGIPWTGVDDWRLAPAARANIDDLVTTAKKTAKDAGKKSGKAAERLTELKDRRKGLKAAKSKLDELGQSDEEIAKIIDDLRLERANSVPSETETAIAKIRATDSYNAARDAEQAISKSVGRNNRLQSDLESYMGSRTARLNPFSSRSRILNEVARDAMRSEIAAAGGYGKAFKNILKGKPIGGDAAKKAATAEAENVAEAGTAEVAEEAAGKGSKGVSRFWKRSKKGAEDAAKITGPGGVAGIPLVWSGILAEAGADHPGGIKGAMEDITKAINEGDYRAMLPWIMATLPAGRRTPIAKRFARATGGSTMPYMAMKGSLGMDATDRFLDNSLYTQEDEEELANLLKAISSEGGVR